MQNSNHTTHTWLRTAVIALLCIFTLQTKAQDADSLQLQHLDSVEVSLLTCEPFHKIYSLYGHTGLRIHNLTDEIVCGLHPHDDIVANWGIFDMTKSFFAVRFAFGLTDYCMAIEPFEGFCSRYFTYGSGVREQVLELTPTEKVTFMAAIWKNYEPENRVYRYNFFFDNCTTRARDMVLNSITGEIQYQPLLSDTSFREMIHQWNEAHQWARWGNDFLLGVGSDRKTNRQDQEFLPDSLRKDFDQITIKRAGGSTSLVKETRWPVAPMYDKGENSTFDKLTSPYALGLGLLILCIILMFIEEFWLKRRVWMFDAVILLLSGICGIVLFCMIFSQHPTVQLNYQILVFNPLSLLFFWPIIKKLRKGEVIYMARLISACAALAIILSVWQTFADGVKDLAWVLLLRFTRFPKRFPKKK